MRKLNILLLLVGIASCNLTTGDDCGPFGPATEAVVLDTLTIALPAGVDSIEISGAHSSPATFEIIRIPASDFIRFEVEIATATISSEPVRTQATFYVDSLSRVMTIFAMRQHTIAGEQLRSQIECTPMPDRMDIKHAKILMPEGLDVLVVSR